MKKLHLILFCILYSFALFAQKPSLTFDAIDDWPLLYNEMISSDGKIAIYKIHKETVEDTLVIQSTDNRWILKVPGGTLPAITANSRLVIYRKRDSLFLYDVQKHRLVNTVGQIASFKTPEAGDGQWVAWLLTDQKLVLCNCRNNQMRTYDSVADYRFSGNGKVLLLKNRHIRERDTTWSIQWIDLANTGMHTIFRNGCRADNLTFDEAAEQLAFLTDEIKNGKPVPAIRYYRKGMDSAIVRVNDATPGIDSNYIISNGGIWFSPNGHRLFFYLKKKPKIANRSNNQADVNIWHYEDDFLATEKAVNESFAAGRNYTAVLQSDGSVLQVDQEKDERFIYFAGMGDYDYAVVSRNINYFDGKWKASTTPSYYLVNIDNGERKQIIAQRDITIHISPGGKYVIWYDKQKSTWFTRENSSGVCKEIAPQLAGNFMPRSQPMRIQPFLPFGIAGWLAEDKAVFIYDEFDIWQIDPKGEKAPVNMTNGYGKRNKTILRLWRNGNNDYAIPVVDKGKQVLTAFNVENKYNGFFATTFDKPTDPVKLSLDPYLYYADLQFNLPLMQHYSMIKAKKAAAFILRRMNSREFPNIYFSRDLKGFTALSQVNPQQDYNWLTNEPITWMQSDSTTGHGILYKPENFDRGKKYPVIFYFYEKLSHRLHQFTHPELSYGSLNIPWFVSNGYLVCTPDISYNPPYPGESALNALVSAARYVSQLPYVDSTKMGLQAHSFGGYQVNYIISHTNIFAAAQESAGASDFISYYNGFYREHSAQFYFEYGQGRIGHTLWEKPELYIQNSPVFNAHQVQTPLLIMHNKGDEEVPFQQGIEWFTALRRLGKKVWMLQYDRESHSINQTRNQMDFTIKMTAFFDHFLKGAPPPRWLLHDEQQ